MFGGGGSPPPTPLPPAPIAPPTVMDPAAAQSRQATVQEAQMANPGTILSSSMGDLTQANTTKLKTVLGD